VQIHEFQNYEQAIFRPVITPGKKYAECQYTNFITRSETSFHALYVTDRLYVKRQNTSSFSCSKSCFSSSSQQLSFKSFVIIRLSSFVESNVSRLTSVNLDLDSMPLNKYHHMLRQMFQQHIQQISNAVQKNKHIIASVGAIQVLVHDSVQLRYMSIEYKRISSLGLSHDPNPYLAEIGCRLSTQTRNT